MYRELIFKPTLTRKAEYKPAYCALSKQWGDLYHAAQSAADSAEKLLNTCPATLIEFALESYQYYQALENSYARQANKYSEFEW